MEGPISDDDPLLLERIRDRFIYPPSSFPYNLEETSDSNDAQEYMSFKLTTTWLLNTANLKKLFINEPPGFFIEVGALDGEYISNTLFLEKDYNWTGLLVEPDSHLFSLLQRKHRKCWSSPLCLSLHPYPHTATLGVIGLIGTGVGIATHGYNALQETKNFAYRLQQGSVVYEKKQCVPLQSLLYSINVTEVDLLSLDVEDSEVGILKSFPFDKINIKVLLVEHYLDNGGTIEGLNLVEDPEFIKWIESKGYTFVYKTLADYMFIKSNSTLLEKAKHITFLKPK